MLFVSSMISCGEDRLLCLHVQQNDPGSPRLSASQNCKRTNHIPPLISVNQWSQSPVCLIVFSFFYQNVPTVLTWMSLGRLQSQCYYSSLSNSITLTFNTPVITKPCWDQKQSRKNYNTGVNNKRLETMRTSQSKQGTRDRHEMEKVNNE